MNYPQIRIVTTSEIGSKVVFIKEEGAEPVDLSGVVASLRIEHRAGDAPALELDIPCPVFECAIEAVKTTINFIDRIDVAEPK